MKCVRCGRDVRGWIQTPSNENVCFGCVAYAGSPFIEVSSAGTSPGLSFSDWSDTHDCTGCKHFNGFNEWGPNCSQCARSKAIQDFYEVKG